jgi:anion-transporting  ArsA/GET3 family ATPase
LRRLAKFVGNQFIEDIAAFLTDFQFVLGGFLERAQSVERLLRRADAAFLLVLAPEVPAVDEALFLAGRLREAAVPLAAFVANRVHERPGLVDVDEIAARFFARPELAGLSRADVDTAAERVARSALDLRKLCDGERRELDRLAERAPGVPIWEVPLLDRDVGSLAALRTVGDHLDRPRP